MRDVSKGNVTCRSSRINLPFVERCDGLALPVGALSKAPDLQATNDCSERLGLDRSGANPIVGPRPLACVSRHSIPTVHVFDCRALFLCLLAQQVPRAVRGILRLAANRSLPPSAASCGFPM